MCLLLARVALVVGSTTIIGVSWVPAFARMTVCAVGARLSSAGVCGVSGFDPVLFAALVLVGVLVTHGRQLTDDPRRGVSVEVRTVGDHGGCLVGKKVGDLGSAGVTYRTGQVPLRVRLLRQYL